MKASSIATKIGASLFFQLLIVGALAGIAFWTARAESPGRMLAAGFSLAALCVFLIVMLYMRRGIAAPLAQLAETIDRLAGGDTSVVVAGAARRDEIGRIASALDGLRESLFERERLAAEQRVGVGRQRRRQDTVEQLVTAFDAVVNGALSAVSANSSRLDSAARSLGSIADEATRSAEAAGGVSAIALSNVQTVASATEELASSVAEIAHQVAQAAAIVGQASALANEADKASLRSTGRRSASARWSRSSTRSPARPISSRSTQRSRRRAPARWARASPSSRRR
jgi:methyl-accepting chemotaxis protein